MTCNVGWFQLARNQGFVFTNASQNDVLFRTHTSNQNLLFGTTPGQPSLLTLTPSVLQTHGNIDLKGHLTSPNPHLYVLGSKFSNSNIEANSLTLHDALTCNRMSNISLDTQHVNVQDDLTVPVIVNASLESSNVYVEYDLFAKDAAISNISADYLECQKMDIGDQLQTPYLFTNYIANSCNISSVFASLNTLQSSNTTIWSLSNTQLTSSNVFVLSNLRTPSIWNNVIHTSNAHISQTVTVPTGRLNNISTSNATITNTLTASNAHILRQLIASCNVFIATLSNNTLAASNATIRNNLHVPVISTSNITSSNLLVTGTAVIQTLSNATIATSNAIVRNSLGINTSSAPVERLHIEGGRIRVAASNTNDHIKIVNPAPTGVAEISLYNTTESIFNKASFGIDLGSNRGTYIWAMGEDRINIMPVTGNIGINTRNPAAKLDVNGAFAVSGRVLTDSNRNLTACNINVSNITCMQIDTQSNAIRAGTIYSGTLISRNIDTQNHNINIGVGQAAVGSILFNTLQGGLVMTNPQFISTSNNVGFHTPDRVLASNMMMGSIDQRATLAHSNQFTSTNFALYQTSQGETFVNAGNSNNLLLGINATPQIIINNQGRIGVHNTQPLYDLDVNGTIAINGSPFVDIGKNITAVSGVYERVFLNQGSNFARQTGGLYLTTNRAFGVEYQPTPTISNMTFITAEGTGGFAFKKLRSPYDSNDGGVTLAQLTNAGFLGLGTVAPSQRLHVVGNAYITNAMAVGTSNPVSSATITAEGLKCIHLTPRHPTGFESAMQAIPQFSMNSNNTFINNAILRADFASNIHAWNFLSVVTQCNQVLYMDQYGNGYFASNLGLGVYRATAKLDVRGSVRVMCDDMVGIDMKTSNVTNSNAVAPYVSIMGRRQDNTPNGAFAGTLALSRHNLAAVTASNVNLGRVLFGGNQLTIAESNVFFSAAIYGVSECNFAASNNMATALTFRTGSNGVYVMDRVQEPGIERMRITNSGCVGINTSTPKEVLEVNGNAKFTQRIIAGTHVYNIASTNQDIATTTQSYWLRLGELADENHAINTFALVLDAILGLPGRQLHANVLIDNAGSSTFNHVCHFKGDTPSDVLQYYDIFTLTRSSPTSLRAYDLFLKVRGTHSYNINAQVTGTGAWIDPSPKTIANDPQLDIATYVDGSYQSMLFTNYDYQRYDGYFGINNANQLGPLHVEDSIENPKMTANFSGAYIVSASSADGGNAAFYAFNKSANTAWIASTSTLPQYLQLQYPTPVIIQKYAIVASSVSVVGTPSAWALQASRDGTSWVTLETRSTISWSYASQIQIFEVTANDVYYQFYRWSFTSVAIPGVAATVQEIRVFTTQPRMVLTSSGNLGISTMNPQYRLQVEGDSAFHGKMIVMDQQDGGNSRGIYMWHVNDPKWGIYMATSGTNRALNNAIAPTGSNFDGLALRMRVDPASNSGFLVENGSNVALFSVRGSDGAGYFLGDVGVRVKPSYNLHVSSPWRGANMRIDGNWNATTFSNHARMYLTNDNFGIGTGAITMSNSLYIFTGASNDFRIMRTSNGLSDTNTSNWMTDVVIQGNTGFVGIGTSNPSSKVHIVGGGVNISHYAERSWMMNGICFIRDVATVGASEIANSQWGYLQLPDPGYERNTDPRGHYLIGRGSTYAERRLSIHLPSYNAYSSAGVSPSLQVVVSNNSNLLTIRASDGYIGVGDCNPSHKLFLKDGHLGMTMCNFIEFGLGTIKDSNSARIGHGFIDSNFYLDITGSGSNAATRRVRITADGGTQVSGPFMIGTSNTNLSYLSFAGTSNHNQIGYSMGLHAFIGERVYNSSNAASEMVIMKLGSRESAANGPDRIRHVAANHVFQTYNSNVNVRSFGEAGAMSTSNAIVDVMTIRENGFVGLSNANPLNRLHISGGGIISDSNLYMTPFAGSKFMYGLVYRSITGNTDTRWYKIARFVTTSGVVTCNVTLRGHIFDGTDTTQFEVLIMGNATSPNIHSAIVGTASTLPGHFDFVLVGGTTPTVSAVYLKCNAGMQVIQLDVMASSVNGECTLFQTTTPFTMAAWNDANSITSLMADITEFITTGIDSIHSAFLTYPMQYTNAQTSNRVWNDKTPTSMFDMTTTTKLEYTLPSFTTNSLTISNSHPLNGTYTVAASTNTSLAFRAFDQNLSTNWAQTPTAYDASGNYIGGNSTLVNGKPYMGEWMQIILPTAWRMTRFAVQANARTIHVLGSIDGIVWDWLSTFTSPAFSTLTTLTMPATSRRFIYFRFVFGAATNSTFTVTHILPMGNVQTRIAFDGGYIGVNTTSAPVAPLMVTATSNVLPENNAIHVTNPNNSTNQHASMMLRTGGANAGNPYISYDIAGVAGWATGIDNTDGDKFKINARYDSLAVDTRLTLDRTGYVGILTTSPQVPLHVSNSNGTSTNITQSNWVAIFQNNTTSVSLAHNQNNGMLIQTGGTNSSLRYAMQVRNNTQVHMFLRDDGWTGWSTVPTLKYDFYDAGTGGTFLTTFRNGTTSVQMASDIGQGLQILANDATSNNMALQATNNSVNVFTVRNNGRVSIFEATGSSATPTVGTLTIAHGNAGGVSSIVFPSAVNNGSDYGFISFTDNDTQYYTAGSTENSALIIGTQNDAITPHGDRVYIKGPFANVFDSARHFFTNTFSGSTALVGINVNLPQAPLHITPSSNPDPFSNAIYIYNSNVGSSNNNATLSLRTNGTTSGNPFVSFDVAGTVGWAMGIDNADSQKFKLSSRYNSLASSNVLSATVGGNVGINTAAPNQRLHVNGNIRCDGFMYFGNNYLRTCSGEHGSIQVSGNAGNSNWEGYSIEGNYVFMSSDATQCGIYNDVDNHWIMYFNRSSTSNRYCSLYANGIERLQCNSGGVRTFGAVNIDINTWHTSSDGQQRLYYTTGGVTLFKSPNGYTFRHSDNTAKVTIDTSGNFWCAGDITAFSDARYKTELKKIEHAMEKVEQLNGYTFSRTDQDDVNKRYMGVLAQEVEKVIPEVVTTQTLDENHKDFKAVAYGNMTALLIEAVKELNAKVNALEKELAFIKSKSPLSHM
jgi:hypothetical protein